MLNEDLRSELTELAEKASALGDQDSQGVEAVLLVLADGDSVMIADLVLASFQARGRQNQSGITRFLQCGNLIADQAGGPIPGSTPMG